MTLIEFAKIALLPGTLGLFLICLTIGVSALCFSRTRRLGITVLVVIISMYWIMSMPVGAWMLGRVVSIGYSPADDLSLLAGVQAIVVLDGDTAHYHRDGKELAVVKPASAIRALEAIRLYRSLQPALVVVTGGAYVAAGQMPEGGAIREVLLAAGVPPERVVLDSMSRNTREHAENVSKLLHAAGATRFAMVTSAVHMRRALRAFDRSGVKAIPAAAPVEMPGRHQWWPSTMALDRSREAWHEIFGLLWDFVR